MIKNSSMFLSFFIATSPIAGMSRHKEIMQEHVSLAIHGSPELINHIYQTQEVVAHFSRSDLEVLKSSHAFLSELYDVYQTGEGIIEKDIHVILNALCFAAQKHQFQTRNDLKATPYIIHPIAVAHHLLVCGKVRDPEILTGALLHDTVEDTETTLEEIEKNFGEKVAKLVLEVTDDQRLSKVERKKLQIENASQQSAGGAQINLSDKYCNLNDLIISSPIDWSKARVEAYFSWAEQVVNRLPWVNANLKKAVDEKIAAYHTPFSSLRKE